MSDWNAKVIDEFRSNGGRVASFARQPLLLLTHRGARSGTARTNPLAYFRDGDDYVVVASKGGAPTNPDWYHNLLANPEATIEVGTDELAVIARPADEQERERLWARITCGEPGVRRLRREDHQDDPGLHPDTDMRMVLRAGVTCLRPARRG